jgi:hypothetical protein
LAGQAVEHALRLQLKSAVAGKPGSGVTLSLFETAVGEDAARQTVSCESCGTEQLLGKLLPELDKVLRQGVGRPRGELEIKSEPSGAEVVVGGRRLGTTPLLRPMFIGVYDPELSLPGYQRQSLRVVVSEGKAARYLLSLESEPEPEPEPLLDGGKLRRERRPTWRLQAGGSLLGIGVGLLGLSAWPLALDGTCQRPPAVATDPCVNLYETRAPGLALSIAGGALMITGGILLLIPGRRIRSARLIPPSE